MSVEYKILGNNLNNHWFRIIKKVQRVFFGQIELEILEVI